MTARERAEIWVRHAAFDGQTRQTAREMMADEQQLLGCFGQELSFGTGGLRGVLGVGTNRMNAYTVARATQGLAQHLSGVERASVAIGYDSRNGSRSFAGVAAGVLAQNGLRAYLFDRLLPTPLLSFAVRALGCAAGIMITASHNPAEYNGYKVYGADGCQLTDDAAGRVTDHIRRVAYEDLRWLGEERARASGLLEDVPREVYDAFIRETLGCRALGDAKLPEIKLVYTPLHGTGLEPVCDVFARMRGVRVQRVEAQCQPNGDFPSCPKPNPELPEALALALQTAREQDAELVLATDPDCDRVGVAVRQDGEYRLLTGNEVGLLLMQYLLEMKTAIKNPVVIKTIVTSDLAREIAAARGAELVEVLTGFKYIGEAMGGLEARGQLGRFVLGFEESCGYLAGTHVRDKDGVAACMLVSEMAQHHKAHNRTLLDALNALYEQYGYAHNALLSFDIPGALPMEAMRARMRQLRANPPRTLLGQTVAECRDYLAGTQGLPPSDVLSFRTRGGLKAIVRPSGTEPKIKAYLSASADSMDAAVAATSRMAEEMRALLGL